MRTASLLLLACLHAAIAWHFYANPQGHNHAAPYDRYATVAAAFTCAWCVLAAAHEAGRRAP